MTELTWKILLQKYNKGNDDTLIYIHLPNDNRLSVFDDGDVKLDVIRDGFRMSIRLGFYNNFSDIDCLIQMMLKGKEDA